jgi:hypothetical protein
MKESSKPLYRGTQIVWYFLAIIEALLVIRFILRLLQANPSAGFTNLIYSFSGIYVKGSVFEWTTLLAMLVYWLLAMAIAKIFVMGKSVTTAEADAKLSAQDSNSSNIR